MEMFTRDNGKKTWLMGWVTTSMSMAAYTMESGRMTCSMAKGLKSGPMEPCSTVSIIKGRCSSVSSLGLMVASTKGSLTRAYFKDLAISSGLTVANIAVNGTLGT
jgi:hypothetical protein